MQDDIAFAQTCTGSGINRSRFYLTRIRKPRDQADFDWALGTASTLSTPTFIGVSSVDDWMRY